MELFRKIDLYLDIFSPRGTHGSIKGRTKITKLVEEAKRDTNSGHARVLVIFMQTEEYLG